MGTKTKRTRYIHTRFLYIVAETSMRSRCKSDEDNVSLRSNYHAHQGRTIIHMRRTEQKNTLHSTPLVSRVQVRRKTQPHAYRGMFRRLLRSGRPCPTRCRLSMILLRVSTSPLRLGRFGCGVWYSAGRLLLMLRIGRHRRFFSSRAPGG